MSLTLKSTARRPRLVFHTGDPKTGTTTIQRVLHDGLISCPTQEILPWRRLNAIAVADSLKPKGKRRQRGEFRAIRKWLARSDADVAVISSEFFASVKPTVLKRALDAYLPGEYYQDLRVISYVRPHASRFLAAFIQRTKTGQYFGDIDTFLTNLQRNESETFLYSRRFPRWKKRFGDKFVLKTFIRTELKDQDIASDFFDEVLGGAPFHIDAKVEENVSVTTRSLAGLRRMHENLRARGLDSKSRSLLGSAMSNHYLGSKQSGGEKPKLDQNTAEQVISTFLGDARKLDADFFPSSIMSNTLERSVENTSVTRIDLTAEAHFGPDELKALDELSASVAASFGLYRRLWALHYHVNHRRVRNYMTPPVKVLINQGAASKRARALDDKLYAIANIIGQ